MDGALDLIDKEEGGRRRREQSGRPPLKGGFHPLSSSSPSHSPDSISLFLFLSSSSGERNCGKIQTRNWESEEMKEEPSGEFPANRLGIRNADYGMLDAGEAGDPIGRAELIRLK